MRRDPLLTRKPGGEERFFFFDPKQASIESPGLNG